MTQNLNIWQDEMAKQQILENFCTPNNLSKGEITTFFRIGQATGLNPFLREIWVVKYNNAPASIFIGRDGYRKSAQAHKEYDYHQAHAVYSSDKFSVESGEVKHAYGDFVKRGQLIGAYGIVKRKSASQPIFIFTEFKEYNTGKSLWGKKPAMMIAKVAEAQSLRMAFQELFAGTYDESENWKDQPTKPEPTKPEPTKPSAPKPWQY